MAHIKNRATLGAAFFNVRITTLYVLKKPRYRNTPNHTTEPIIIKRSFTIIMTYHKFKNSNLPSILNVFPYVFIKKFIVSYFSNCALYIALEHKPRDRVQIKITSKFSNVLNADSMRLCVT
ncbi:hypothetical protein ANTPLA_LOCUS2391 [Anthophora plagiata]